LWHAQWTLEITNLTQVSAMQQVCIEGELTVNSVPLAMRDALEAVNGSDTENLPLTLESGPAGSHFLLIEMRRA
jgi:hypothetical protein